MNNKNKALTIGSDFLGVRASIVEAGALAGEGFSSFEASAFVSSSSRSDILVCVEDAVGQALAAGGVEPAEISFAAAYGPISSRHGIREVPAELAPAGIRELRAGVATGPIGIEGLPEVRFIPGLRNFIEELGPDTIGQADAIHGEESYAVGLMELAGLEGPCHLVICGRRTKYLKIDARNRIASCLSTYCGQLANAILSWIRFRFPYEAFPKIDPDRAWLRRGARAFSRAGFSRGLFEAELLGRLVEEIGETELLSYILGVVAQADFDSAWRLGFFEREGGIKIAGDNPWRDIFSTLAADEFGAKRVSTCDEATHALAAPIGALKIAGFRTAE